ncbi:MAG: tRNA pseudouridine(38-40) synthase TruA [Clostridiales bacterium]|jgi:tRNA pseudouridine38-40 synthase|nr:tRNA pseudouridine(38-40) synthase TruA [Clostridiales bacterium]
MRRLKLTIEYKGTRYSGWQRQENAVGIQNVLENALAYVLNEKVALIASGRTDMGVHAYAQIAHFDTCASMHTDRLPGAANSQLPPDIRVLACEEAPDNFSARFSVKSKTYLYKAYVSKISSPLRFETHWQILPPVDLEKMRRAAAHFVGEHDFTSFMSKGSTPLNGHTRRILAFDVRGAERDEIRFTVTGTGFLYNQVRVMVMAAVNAGQGKLDPDAVPRILESKDRGLVKELAPAKGLYLYKVEY